ncbi:hypothetical protein NA57DRAFT_59991 [Rhizodiscina lignyota]|uniref:Uncharacterized protein n=1 Tax=Rhizodiscina lignyota TaxID=1504668 RepID=A0A9P4I502_9PEZI|nr:hypothetical protein NA57DRAFT_59991 [Rhizodiscina lignyota]
MSSVDNRNSPVCLFVSLHLLLSPERQRYEARGDRNTKKSPQAPNSQILDPRSLDPPVALRRSWEFQPGAASAPTTGSDSRAEQRNGTHGAAIRKGADRPMRTPVDKAPSQAPRLGVYSDGRRVQRVTLGSCIKLWNQLC